MTKKKFIIIGFSLVLLIIAALLIWYNKKHPSDSTIRKEYLGTWVAQGAMGHSTIDIYSDGHFIAQLTGRRAGKLEGTWRVQDGFIISTYTNSSFTKHLPYSESDQVLRMNGHELVTQYGKDVFVKHKVEP